MKTNIPYADRCIACTTCTVVCPVSQATPEFLGPRMMGPAQERFRLVGLGEDDSLPYCSNCKNCDISCPCDVPVSTFIMRARAEVSREHRPPLRDWFLAHGEVIARWLAFVPAFLKNFGMRLGPVRFVLHKLGISREAPLPDFDRKSFRARFSRLAQPKGLSRQVAFFPGCYVDIYDAQSGLDMVAVLNRAGYEVVVPGKFVCCGLPLVANGFWEDARKNAEINLAELKAWKDRGFTVITGCPSCALMFKEDYAQYFPDLLPRNLSPALADACEFLLDCVARGELAVPPRRICSDEDQTRTSVGPDRVLYHAPCHLRAQGIGMPGFSLLREIPGLIAENAGTGCCGISGSYGFKSDKYDISMRVGAELFKKMRESEARLCASECGTCRVQMRHGGGKETLHPITILRRYLEAHTKEPADR